MLDKEFKYYLDHQEELLPLYNGKYIVIIDEHVVGSYDNREDAYYSSMEKIERMNEDNMSRDIFDIETPCAGWRVLTIK